MSLVVRGLKGKTINFPRTCSKILENAFRDTEIERIVLPKTLEEIGSGVFSGCNKLKTIYVEDGCEASLSHAGLSDSIRVGPLPEAMLGNTKIWDLRELKDVIIQNGTERIGN